MNSRGITENDIKSLSRMIPDAWRVFFKKRLPREIQSEAIPHIVRGESVLLFSPTASGKTEAVLAPIYQRHISFHRDNLSAIYIAPTRALVNDLYERLKEYFIERTDKLITRYTGDHHEDVSSCRFLLLTTPEALDSLLLTRSSLFRDIRSIIVDEVHFIDGTPRGQHLRHLLTRLRSYIAPSRDLRDKLQTIIMTATTSESDDLALRWIGREATQIRIHQVRGIDCEYLTIDEDEQNSIEANKSIAINHYLREHRPTKILLFTNSRNAAHKTASHLNDLLQNSRWNVYLHFGSLARDEREHVEEEFKKCAFGICVATSTLEVGIDIGNIDTVILVDLPHSINEYLQRIGRGNRRSDRSKVVALYSNKFEKKVLEAYHSCAEKGVMDDIYDYDRPSVKFQQVLGLAWIGALRNNPLTMKNLVARCGDTSFKGIANDMVSTGALKLNCDELSPSDFWWDICELRQIHSVISSPGQTPVIDASTGEVVTYTGFSGTGKIMFHNKLHEVKESSDGNFYIERSTRSETKLINLSQRGNKRQLKNSRSIQFVIAKESGFDPYRWVHENNQLLTWGGELYNYMLSKALVKLKLAAVQEYNDSTVFRIYDDQTITPNQVLEYAITNMITLLAKESIFLQPSKYFQQLSSVMKQIERENSIPIQPFLVWLSKCKSGSEC